MSTYPYPPITARPLSDDQRNQLAELRHEACEHHCADCGRCDWESCNPPGATRDVPMIEVDGEWFCDDCYCPTCDSLGVVPVVQAGPDVFGNYDVDDAPCPQCGCDTEHYHDGFTPHE